jgi:hypothetical protein
LTACRIFTDVDGLATDEPGPRADAAAEDAVARTDASPESGGGAETGADAVVDAAPDAASSEVENGGFEVGPGCGSNWEAFHSSVSQDPVAHSGQSSCRVCRTDTGNGVFDMRADGFIRIPTGATQCTASAYIMGAPDAAAGQTIRVGIDWHDRDGVYMFDTGRNDLPVPATWTQFSHGDAVPQNAVFARVFVGGNGDQGQCVLVDDVTFSCR